MREVKLDKCHVKCADCQGHIKPRDIDIDREFSVWFNERRFTSTELRTAADLKDLSVWREAFVAGYRLRTNGR